MVGINACSRLRSEKNSEDRRKQDGTEQNSGKLRALQKQILKTILFWLLKFWKLHFSWNLSYSSSGCPRKVRVEKSIRNIS